MTRGQHKNAFVVDEVSGPRFELALELFLSGRSFEFHDVAFRAEGDNAVHCIVDSSWEMTNVTMASAAEDLDYGASAFADLLAQSPAFASAVEGRPIYFDLIEDYGNGSILLCTRTNGTVTWARGFPRGTG
jgi:hypothetical protein